MSLHLKFMLNSFHNTFSGLSATPAETREHLIEKLRVVLSSGSDEECSVCLDSVRLPVITHCAHVYCRPCITQVISTEQVLPIWLQAAVLSSDTRKKQNLSVLVFSVFRKKPAVLSAGVRSKPVNWWRFHLKKWMKPRA